MNGRIIILGGGIIGLSAGVSLARAGLGVTILDDDSDRQAASWGNAGHLAVEQVEPLASPAALRSAWRRRFAAGGALDLPVAQAPTWLPFAARYLCASTPNRFARGRAVLGDLLADAMPAWTRLVDAIGAPDLIRRDGHLVVWERADAADRRAAWEAAETGGATVHDTDARDRAAIGALVSAPVSGSARFAGTAQITDLRALADALEAALQAAGGRIVHTTVRLDVERARARIAGFEADLVLIAAGARSGAPMRAAGHRVPLIAERGYHLRGRADRWPADMPPIVFEDRSMIVTRYADCVQAASFVEFAAPGAPPDPRKWERLEAHVAELDLPIGGPFTRWIGARPTLPDYLPAIGRSARVPNLFYAFGHQHLGLTLAATTAERITAIVGGAAGPAALDIERFGGMR
jgi:D-amino-acid dehydrogenase